MTTAPFVQAQLGLDQGNVYSIQIQNGELIELRADRILHHTNRFITLQRGNKTVAVFSPYQVMYVVQKTPNAVNLFEVQSQDGSTVQFRADDMRLDPQGFVELSVDGQLSGIVGNQTRYVRLVDGTD